MKRHFNKYIYTFFLCLAFGGGHFSHSILNKKSTYSVDGFRSAASETDERIFYENLDCPSESEYLQLKRKIGFTGSLTGSLCDNSNKAKLGKLLKYISHLDIAIPPSWEGGANKALSDTINYLDSMIGELSLDLSQKESYAFNLKDNVYLGLAFFNSGPLRALLTLVHEARHCSPHDPGHVKCGVGVKAQVDGSCDILFDTGERAGAYAYSLSFALAMAKYERNLSPADREYLIAWGLASMGNNFVSVPPWLGLPIETIVVSGENNHLYYIHPILRRPILYDYGGLLGILRIKFRRSNGGLYLITKEGEVFLTKPFSKARRIKRSIIKEELHVKDIAWLVWGSNNYGFRIHLLDKNHLIWHTHFDSEKRKWLTEEFNLPSNDVSFIQLAHVNRTLRAVLTENGQLVYLRTDESSGSHFIDESEFQDPRGQGWIYIDGGFLYDQIFGINENGELFYQNESKINKSIFQVGRSKTYLESINFRIQVNNNGEIFVKKYGENSVFHLDLTAYGVNVTSIAYIRSFLFDKSFEIEKSVPDDIKESCRLLVKSSVDPWTHMAMGINSNNELVFQTSDSHCEAVDLGGKVKDYKLSGRIDWELSRDEIPLPDDFSRIYLKVTFSNGEETKIYPYSP